jgi:amino acid transporter
MNRAIRVLGWTLLLSAVASVAIVAIVLASIGPLDQAVIQLDDGALTLTPFDTGHWLVTLASVAFALVVTLLVVVLVVPVAVFVPLLVAALALAGALFVVACLAAVAFSPMLALLALVWLIWRLVRSHASKRRAPIHPATAR